MTPLSPALCSLARDRLKQVDCLAKENVQSHKGGPFAAQMLLLGLDRSGGAEVRVSFPITTNRVLETGIASCHAEAQSMTASAVMGLKKAINEIHQEQRLSPFVLFLSSAQPCMACLAKIELLARDLVRTNLIKQKDFVLVYGASYAETEKVAGFHDYAYALDFFAFFQKKTTLGSGLLACREASVDTIPEDVRFALFSNSMVKSVLADQERILGLGYDRRSSYELFKTAECVALHEASHALRRNKNPKPWDLRSGTLYTIDQSIGPLCYTECQWASVKNIVLLDPQAQSEKVSCDCLACSNDAFFAGLSEGYNSPWSALQVYRDTGFVNLAQKEWANTSEHVWYNGCEDVDQSQEEDKRSFDSLFMPLPLAP